MAELRRSTRVAANKRASKEDNNDKSLPSKKPKVDDAPKETKKEGEQEQEVNHGSKEDDTKTNAKGGLEEDEENAASEDKELEVGDEIPDLVLQNQDEEDISLKKTAEENKIIIIFAYPKASTPGCTRQACGYRDNYDELKKHAAVFGLSNDKPKPQKNFQTKQRLPFDLLCDPKRQLIGLLGAKKTPQSGTIRSHWIFVDGKLKSKKIKISPEISVEEGKKEVMDLAKELEG